MKYVYYIFFTIIVLASCGKKEVELSPAQIKSKADSIIIIRVDELNKQYTEDLEKRLVVEVKGKADSIVEANRVKDHPQVDTVAINHTTTGVRPNPRKIDTAKKANIIKEP